MALTTSQCHEIFLESNEEVSENVFPYYCTVFYNSNSFDLIFFSTNINILTPRGQWNHEVRASGVRFYSWPFSKKMRKNKYLDGRCQTGTAIIKFNFGLRGVRNSLFSMRLSLRNRVGLNSLKNCGGEGIEISWHCPLKKVSRSCAVMDSTESF